MTSRILVGLDQSAESIVALRWAGSLAEALGAQVHVGYAWFRRGQLDGMRAHAPEPEDLEAAIESRLRDVAEASKPLDHIRCTAHALRGGPAHALQMAAERLDAELLVVGASSRSLFSRLVRSSVSRGLAVRPRRPLALVPRDSKVGRWADGTVIVGVDGSASSARAVRWATDVVRRGGGRILGLHAFDPGIDLAPSSALQLLEEVTGRLQHEWCTVIEDQGVDHDTRAVPGDPALVIQSVANEVQANCVVIGSSERTSLIHKLTGGVSQRIGRDPTLPTIIVPSPHDRVAW